MYSQYFLGEVEVLKMVLYHIPISETSYRIAQCCPELDKLYRSTTFWRFKLNGGTKREYVKSLLLELREIYRNMVQAGSKRKILKRNVKDILYPTESVWIVGNKTDKFILNKIRKQTNTNSLIGLTLYVEKERGKLTKLRNKQRAPKLINWSIFDIPDNIMGRRGIKGAKGAQGPKGAR